MKKYEIIAKLYNRLFHDRIAIFFYLCLLGFLLSLVVYPLTDDLWGFFLYISIVAGILTLTTVRLSNNSVYSRLTKHLSMNIRSFEGYHRFNYIEDRASIAKLYQEEFIVAIESAHRKRYKTIKMTTHAWVYEQVILHPRIQSIYSPKAKESGSCKAPLEIVLLVTPSVIRSEPSKIYELATRSRKQYKIILKLKTEI